MIIRFAIINTSKRNTLKTGEYQNEKRRITSNAAKCFNQ